MGEARARTIPFVLPDEVFASHLAVLGKTGAGKSTTIKDICEHLVPQGARICIIDPIKSDYWGLTSSADGTKPGLPFHILGGPRGHLPLHESSGAAIAELVASAALPLSILDMKLFGPGGHSRFFIDFAPKLLNSMRGVLYLVIDEAHIFAPKERSGLGDENLGIHYAKLLATAGRSEGIRLILATQRTQALHNAMLGSCETVVAHRLTAPADQKPVIDWLKANVAKDIAAEIAGSLSSLPTGTGWVCSGEAKFFQQVAFPRIQTFDNSATPTGDLAQIKVRTATVDVDKLRAIIGDAAKQAEANDPKALKAEIARLKAAKPEVARNPGELADAEQRGYERGHDDGSANVLNSIGRIADDLAASLRAAKESCDQSERLLASFGTFTGAMASSPRIAPPMPSIPALKINMAEMKAPSRAGPPPRGDVTLSGPQRHLLGTLTWWTVMGHAAPTRTQLAARAGWAPKGSTLRARLSELNAAELVEYPETGRVKLTTKGASRAPQPDMSVSLLDSIRAVLSGPQTVLFDALDGAQATLTRTALADRVGWEPGGSTMRARLSELRQLELIEYPGKGNVRLQAWVTA